MGVDEFPFRPEDVAAFQAGPEIPREIWFPSVGVAELRQLHVEFSDDLSPVGIGHGPQSGQSAT